jgi:proline iminopeptidase
MKKAFFFLVTILLFSCRDSTKRQVENNSSTIDSVSINEKTFIELGGDKQYVEMTGVSSKNPVLLFLHGGPGWPQTPHLRYFNADLTKSITLVAWEQSGCGKSYMNNPNPKNLSIDQLINDAHELTLILKNKFHKDKIYLVGFSWGSVIGLQLIKKYPNDYAAYFGISQVIDLNRSIELSRNWIKEQAKQKNDIKMLKLVAQLEKQDTALCKNTLDCFLKKYEFLTEYGGAIHTKEAETQIKIAETKYEDYKNYDWLKGFTYSCDRLGNALFETNLTTITNVEVPVYFFVGRHDWSLPTIVTEDFVKKLVAPKKEIVWFENSGHEPLDEEPKAFNQAIIDRIVK